MVYTVTFNPALDYVMTLKKINENDVNRCENATFFYGGKGINVSVILKRLKIETKALGFIAGFTGLQLEKMLLEDGIDCDLIRLESGGTRVNVKIKSGIELDFNADGPTVTQNDIDKLTRKLKSLKKGDFLVLAGSIPPSLSTDTYENILNKLDGIGVNFVIDAEGGLLLKALKFKPFLIKPNHHELGRIFNTEIKTDDDIIKHSKMLQVLGAKNVLISCGKDGAVLLDESGNIHKIGVPDGKAINTVGCGDSMVAGFIASYLKNGDYSHALRLGTACASATAFSNGLATKEKIEELFNALN